MRRKQCYNHLLGFVWDNLRVERVHRHSKQGNILALSTETHIIELRITPSGKIKVIKEINE
jgi:hypothetical protein